MFLNQALMENYGIWTKIHFLEDQDHFELIERLRTKDSVLTQVS